MLIQQLRLSNVLSFGPDTDPLDLRPLNVVIGPNGSGKSNLLDVIDLLRNAPDQIAKPIRESGGIQDWLWKGQQTELSAQIGINAYGGGEYFFQDLQYSISFMNSFRGTFEISEETLKNKNENSDRFIYHMRDGYSKLFAKKSKIPIEFTINDRESSIFAQRRDPDRYPELTYLAWKLSKIVLYREWSFGRNTVPRLPQRADLPNDTLAPDASNLGMVLNRLRQTSAVKAKLLAALQKLYDGIKEYDVRIEGGTVQVFFDERGTTIPATRLSDGTLRYLCLLAILCHPNPPPLVCIEEPELGLHPDMMPTIADLLRDASQRCQLIVTTHSDALVDAMTDTPEDVLVCEKHDGATTFKRLDKDELKPWLERYRLGELWRRGDIGGTRW